jgi:hypothetical protein
MRRLLAAISLVCLLSLPSYAIKLMMFNSVDQYIERAGGIWIVEVLQQNGQEPEIGPTYEVKIIQTLKGDSKKETFSLCAISRQLISGSRYLVFGFNRAPDSGAWVDNGNVSPIPVPPSFSLAAVKGEPVENQISLIMSARSSEIDSLIKQLSEEKKALENGLDFQRRLDKLPSKKR